MEDLYQIYFISTLLSQALTHWGLEMKPKSAEEVSSMKWSLYQE